MTTWINNGAKNTSSASGYYRVESQNLGFSSSGVISLSGQKVIPVTFANAGNCKGLGISLYSSADVNDRSINIALQENVGAVTMTIANPGVVNFAGHGFTSGDRVSFSTTGTLPTGLTAGVEYFVKTVLTSGTFTLATTSGGSAFAFTGSAGSGHSMWKNRMLETFTRANISSCTNSLTNWIIDFWFTTPYAVDATASKWRFGLNQTGGTTGTWSVTTSDAVNITYFTWCDTLGTLGASGDTLIVGTGGVTIDSSHTLQVAAMPVGDASNGTALVICTNRTDQTPANVCLLKCLTPASNYSFIMKGNLLAGSHAGFRLGTKATPIPFAQQLTFGWDVPNLGTAAGWTYPGNNFGKYSMFIHGSIATRSFATITSDAATGQKNITVNEDISTWQNGDEVALGKNDVISQGDTTLYTISSIAGQTITLNVNIATNVRKAGGTIINFNRMGVKFISTRVNGSTLNPYNPNNIQMSGVYIVDVGTSVYSTGNINTQETAGLREQWTFNDIVYRSTNSSQYYILGTCNVPPLGVDMRRCYCFRGIPVYQAFAYYATYFKSGRFVIEDTKSVAGYGGGILNQPSATPLKMTVRRNSVENNRNGSYPAFNIWGVDLIFEDNSVWGHANINTTGGAVSVSAVINPQSIKNTKIDKSTCGMVFASSVSVSAKDLNTQFGQLAANTEDIFFYSDCLIDYQMITPLGITTITRTNQTLMTPGSKLRITNFNNTATDDRIISTYGDFQRCGYGLADTLVWNGTTWTAASAGQCSLRYAPNDGTNPLIYTQDKVIGDCQGKNVNVTARVYINSHTYYDGVHDGPRLRVKYDDGTHEATVEVPDETVGAYQLSVNFTPTTNSKFITISIEGATDQTGTNAYFYLGEILVNPPEGVFVDTTRITDWSSALPIGNLRTMPAPQSIWDSLTANHTVSGSFGEKEANDMTSDDYIGLSD